MSVPKRRQTSSRTNRRRAHDGMSSLNLVDCKKCKAKRLSHKVCLECGFYGDRKVTTVKKKATEA